MKTSSDEGRSWSDPVLCVPAPGYFVVNNDRVIQLESGRLVAPAAYHRARHTGEAMSWSAFDRRGIAIFFLSDDAGASWRESKDWWAFPGRCASGLQEPGVIELRDGRLFSFCRTDAGCQYEMYSEDGGDTWSAPRPSRFRSPCSPLSIKRVPRSGDLLAVWNDQADQGEAASSASHPLSWGRTPLAAALSADDGKTWSSPRLLEDDPDRGFCYVAIHFTDDAVLLAYCCGQGGKGRAVLQDLCVRRVPYEWLYEGP
jgi:hypothetical protein